MIIDRKKVVLTEMQKKVLMSGWGEESVEKSTVESITYDSDGLKVKGYIAYPKNVDRSFPSIIWCRGGYGNAGALDDFHAQGILGQIASWGYVVFESQYRGNAGGDGLDEFGGSDLNDIFNLIPLAEGLEFADNSIWGIEGWSRGGMMVYLALTKSAQFKAAISTGGISNLQCSADESNFMKKLFSKHHGNFDEQFCRQRTILNFVEKYSKSTPTLLIHGTDDDRVPAHHSLDLSQKFLDFGIDQKLVLLENGDHFLKDHKSEVDDLRKKWFEKYLK